MTKKDGDKLREMASTLRKMSTDYAPLGTLSQSKPKTEAAVMWEIAEAIDALLEGRIQ